MLTTAAAIVGLCAAPGVASAQATAGLSVRIDPRIELLATVFRIAGNPEYNQGRVPSYVQAIDQHFAAHREHPVILEARRLRSSNGIGFDAVMSLAIHIDDVESPQLRRTITSPDVSLERRWRPADAGRFTTLLAQFVKDARYAEFIASQRAVLDSAKSSMDRVVRENIDVDAIQKFFGRDLAGAFIMVPLVANGGANFGPRYIEGAHEEVYAIIGTSAGADGWPSFNAAFVPTMVHEFSHSFVNPAVKAVEAQFRAAGEALYSKVQTEMRAQAYATWQTMIHESLVRASVARYVLAKRGEDAARAEIAAQHARAFHWTDALYHLLGEYEADRGRYPTIDAFLPRIAQMFTDFVPRIDGVLTAFEAKRPRVASIEPGNGSEAVDPALDRIVIRFDRPMGPRYNINLGPGGRERFPDIGTVQWDSTGTVLTMHVKLKPASQYELVLGSGFITRADGAPLREVTVRFRTR